MPRTKTGAVWQVSREKLQEIVDTSDNLISVVSKLGLTGSSYNKSLKRRFSKEHISLDKFIFNKTRSSKSRRQTRFSIDEILVKDSSYARCDLKRRLIKEGLLKYECQACKNTGEWLEQKLCLQLDHINGVNNDNRLENLRFLCPNCHSLTDTFCGKLNRAVIKCADCDAKVSKTAELCVACSGKTQRKFDPSKEELEKLLLIDKKPMTEIGRIYGVTDNSVRKRCGILGIEVPRCHTTNKIVFTNEIIDKILLMRKNGSSYPAIGRELNTTEHIIRYQCRKYQSLEKEIQ